MICGGSSTKQQRSVGDAKHTQTRSAVPVTLLQSHFFHHGQHSAFWVPRPQDLTLPHAAFTIAQTSCVLGAQTAGLITSTTCASLPETLRLSPLLQATTVQLSVLLVHLFSTSPWIHNIIDGGLERLLEILRMITLVRVNAAKRKTLTAFAILARLD